jgi:hypothetical protein
VAGIAVLTFVLGAIAVASGSGSDATLEPNATVEPHGPGIVLDGYDGCKSEQEPCEFVWVSMDFYARLSGDRSVKYPQDYGLAECPPPTHDDGLEPDESLTIDEINEAPECAVHPRMAIARVSMTPESAEAFREQFRCGTSELKACQVEALERAG